jgi:DHA2 family multidrug resistance protein
MLALALFHMSGFDTQMGFGDIALARMFQAVGFAFLFVPINTAAYAFLPKNKNNAASGLINLARNVGGSVGISVVTTMLARRTQVHTAYLNSFVRGGSEKLRAATQAATRMFIIHGSSPQMASHQATAMIAGTVDQQATMLAYLDNFRLLGSAVVLMIPLIFLMRKVKPGGSIAVH